MNDVEMLQWAGTGFAMGQASQAVRDAADQQLPSIHDHGLRGLLDYLVD